MVSRLCEPIDGIDAFHIAQSLGLDPSGFRHKSSSNNSNLIMAPPQLSKQQKKLESFMNELEKFTNCVPFKYTCPNCRAETTWQLPFTKTNQVNIKQESSVPDEYIEQADEDIIPGMKIEGINVKKEPTVPAYNGNMKCILDACSNQSCKLKPYTKLAYVKNCLQMQMNKFIKQYYQVRLLLSNDLLVIIILPKI